MLETFAFVEMSLCILASFISLAFTQWRFQVTPMSIEPIITNYEAAYEDLCQMGARFLRLLNERKLEWSTEAQAFWLELRTVRNDFAKRLAMADLREMQW